MENGTGGSFSSLSSHPNFKKVNVPFIIKKKKCCQVLVAHTYNPSYSGGRDQEDHGSKPACKNNSQDPMSKNTPPQKRARVPQRVGPSSNLKP
jgi:hypothetical protein